jgi:hypothetical protein
VVEFVVVPEPLVQNSMANLRIFEIKHQSKHSRYAGGCHREATRINKYKYLNIYIYILCVYYIYKSYYIYIYVCVRVCFQSNFIP